MNSLVWGKAQIHSVDLSGDRGECVCNKQGSEEGDISSLKRGQGLMFPQINRDQTLFPSKTLGKWQKPRNEQEILFPFFPKHEMEERPLARTRPDL